MKKLLLAATLAFTSLAGNSYATTYGYWKGYANDSYFQYYCQQDITNNNNKVLISKSNTGLALHIIFKNTRVADAIPSKVKINFMVLGKTYTLDCNNFSDGDVYDSVIDITPELMQSLVKTSGFDTSTVVFTVYGTSDRYGIFQLVNGTFEARGIGKAMITVLG